MSMTEPKAKVTNSNNQCSRTFSWFEYLITYVILFVPVLASLITGWKTEESNDILRLHTHNSLNFVWIPEQP